MLLTSLMFGHAAFAAASTASRTSADGAVPVRVSVSPSMLKPKSGIPAAAASNTLPTADTSGVLTPGRRFRLSIKLTSAPNFPRSQSNSEALAAASGRSPVRVKSLPLREIDNGANDRVGELTSGPLTSGAFTSGAVIVAVGFTSGRLSSASLFERSRPPHPISPSNNGTTASANNQPNPGGRRYNLEAVCQPVIVRDSSEPDILGTP